MKIAFILMDYLDSNHCYSRYSINWSSILSL